MSSLVRYVYVHDADGLAHGFGPGDAVPAWARKKITNPTVWADTADQSEVVGDPDPGETDSDSADLDDSEDRADEPNPPTGGAVGEAPAKTGPGASRQKWADFAAANGVEVDQSWKREDIIAACEKAGLA